MTDRTKGILLALTAPIMWGVMGVFSRNLGAAEMSDFDISFLRCIIAGAGYLIIVLVSSRDALKTGGRGFFICFISGSILYCLSFLTYNMSVQRIPIAAATVLMFMSPVWILLIGKIVFKDKLERKHIAGAIACLAGAVLVSGLLSMKSGSALSEALDPLGVIMGILNGICLALQIMVPRYFAESYSRDAMLVYGFLGAALLLAFKTDFSHMISVMTGPGGSDVVWNVLGIGVLCTLVANVAYVKSTEYVSTATAGLMSTLEVVIAAAAGFLILGETLAVMQIIGGLLIIAGTLGVELVRGNVSRLGG